MKRIIPIVALLSLVVLAGCKTKEGLEEKEPVVTHPEKNRFTDVVENYVPWKSFSSKGTAAIANSYMSSSIEIKMIHGKAMQISLRPVLGIEVGRLLMTADSVYLYDKVNKHYVAESIAVLNKTMPIEVSIQEIQNIFLGRIFLLENKKDVTVENVGDFAVHSGMNDDWVLEPRKQPNSFAYSFMLHKQTLKEVQATHNTSKQKITCSYDATKKIGQFVIPSALHVATASEGKSYGLNISYDTSTMVWDSNFSIERLSTRGYKRMTLTEMFKKLMP